MNTLVFLLCFTTALCIARMHERTTKKMIPKKYFLIVVMLLGFAIAYGGSKGGGGEEPPPSPPEEPDEPDEPLPPVIEGAKVKLIGRYEDGRFIPLTSEWIEVVATNSVIEVEQIEELIDE